MIPTLPLEERSMLADVDIEIVEWAPWSLDCLTTISKVTLGAVKHSDVVYEDTNLLTHSLKNHTTMVSKTYIALVFNPTSIEYGKVQLT